MKIGFFGGCFNPPTFAHINLAKKALKESNLDKVIFVPVGDFYDKKDLAPAIDRYNMLKIIADKIEKIEVSDIELCEKRKLFAIDVFRLIKEKYPNDDLFFIMGADNFIKVLQWKNSEVLSTQYKYIVFERENINIKEYIKNKFKSNVIIIENSEYKTFSSSKYRNNKKNLDIDDLNIVPDDVLEYINKNKLYI